VKGEMETLQARLNRSRIKLKNPEEVDFIPDISLQNTGTIEAAGKHRQTIQASTKSWNQSKLRNKNLSGSGEIN
jgi:hypothetical protein